jgi:hypothetical protein
MIADSDCFTISKIIRITFRFHTLVFRKSESNEQQATMKLSFCLLSLCALAAGVHVEGKSFALHASAHTVEVKATDH